MTASVKALRAFRVAGLKSEYSSVLSSEALSTVLDLRVSLPGVSLLVALQSKVRLTTSIPSSLLFRLPSAEGPCPPAPVWFDASHVACSTIPPAAPIKTSPTRPNTRYVVAHNPTAQAPSVSLLAVDRKFKTASVASRTLSEAIGVVSFPFLLASSSAGGEVSLMELDRTLGVVDCASRGLVDPLSMVDIRLAVHVFVSLTHDDSFYLQLVEARERSIRNKQLKCLANRPLIAVRPPLPNIPAEDDYGS
jgi:hypothetical protein